MPYITGSDVQNLSVTSLNTNTLDFSNIGKTSSSISTSISLDAKVLVSLSTDTYRSVNFQIQAEQGSNFNITTINVVHNQSTVYLSEYGTINEPVGIATYNADINSGNLRLIGYASSTASTTYRVIYTATEAKR
jgi:hypothetical protein|tara:strand:- start:5 stop:406 length:402 start_codon:yes stop_codon:yes gene_type:complete